MSNVYPVRKYLHTLNHFPFFPFKLHNRCIRNVIVLFQLPWNYLIGKWKNQFKPIISKIKYQINVQVVGNQIFNISIWLDVKSDYNLGSTIHQSFFWFSIWKEKPISLCSKNDFWYTHLKPNSSPIRISFK